MPKKSVRSERSQPEGSGEAPAASRTQEIDYSNPNWRLTEAGMNVRPKSPSLLFVLAFGLPLIAVVVFALLRR